ncbi:MAG: IclR family transcriptional regulator [Umezawaea sp.]
MESRSPAVTRAMGVLEELARRREPVGLTDLARSLDLAKSTVANLCAALEQSHVVRRVGTRWALDYKVVEFSESFLAATDLVGEFRTTAAALPTAGVETMVLGVLDWPDVLYLARHEGSQAVRLANDIGRKLPAVTTALGKAMLSSLPPQELDDRLRRLGELPAFTTRSHRTLESLRHDLDESRRRGYAVDDEQYTEGVTCFSVALPGQPGTPVAVSATMLTARVTDGLRDAVVADLCSLATRLGQLTVR